MTENDEKVAEEFAKQAEEQNIDEGKKCCEHCGNTAMGDVSRTATLRWAKRGFLAGLAHERARSQKLVEAIRMHLSTMNDINIHLGYQFTRPLINLQKKVKEYEGEAK